jgi:hypothetical protein
VLQDLKRAQQDVTFADQPVGREVSDVNTSVLSADYVNGPVTVNPLPSLTIEQKKKKPIRLTWPLWATNFSLQHSDGGTDPITLLEESGNYSDAHDKSKLPDTSGREHE